MSDGIVEVCNTLANEGIRVIVAGLDMDYKGVPFKNMANLWTGPPLSLETSTILQRK